MNEKYDEKQGEPVLAAEGLIRNYTKTGEQKGKDEIKVLKGLNFQVDRQEFVGIMGRSGCGKTTLLKILGMIDRQTDGKLYFKGSDTEELWKDELADIRRRDIGFVFQDFYLMDSLTVRENIMLPKILDKGTAKDCIQKAEESAEQFGIRHLLDKKPYELSGGEKQRVAICRALINDPELILADEPTGNLDSKSSRAVIASFERARQELGATIFMVTHDSFSASYCDRVILMRDGMVYRELPNSGNRSAFQDELLSAIKDMSGE